MKKVFVLIWFCVMFVAAQAQVEKGVSSTGQLGTTGDTRSFVDEKGHIVTRPRLTRTGKIIRTTIASVITSPTGTVTTITAISGGNVLSDGGAEVTARGVCWSTSPNPTLENSIGHTTDGIGVGEFTSELTGLLECTTYYVRAYATNSVGTTYGEQETFNTLPDMEYAINFGYSVDFGKVTIVSTSATSAVWKNSSNQTVGEWVSGTTPVLPVGTYTVELTSEDCGTNTISLNILSSPICAVELVNVNETAFTPTYSGKYINALKDIEENTYNVVQIGEQCWIKENLRSTTYADGIDLPLGPYGSQSEPYRYYPNNDETIVPTYGYLYNWTAVMHGASSSNANPSGVQGVCPNGWHLPSQAEFEQLTAFVDNHKDDPDYGYQNIGKALVTTDGWTNPGDQTVMPNNAIGFSALPAGCAFGTNRPDFGTIAAFFSSTILGTGGSDNVYALQVSPEIASQLSTWKNYSYSVRCVRNEGCELSMDYTINLGNSDDFGRVTINSTNASAASWKDSNGVEIGTWVSGKTDILPVGKYTVELTGDCGTRTITGIRLDVSPICSVESINEDNEIAFEPTSYSPSYTGKFISKMKDIDENEYNVLQMGKICWIRENLKTKTFSNGTAIQHGANKEVSNNIAYYEYPANDEGNVSKYGLLYNWPAAMCNQVNLDPAKTVQGVCPDGWHLLGGPDMDQLGDDFDISKFICGGEEDWMAKALSTTTDWNSSSVECAVGNDLTTNNTTGAAMLPAGYRSGNHYEPLGNNGFLWLALGTNTTGAINMKFYYDNPEADIPSVDNPRSDAYSVRCIRGKICDPAIFDYTINMGNSDDFGRVTINSTNAISASWKDSNGVVIGTWIEGKTDILPVGTYTIVLSLNCGGTQTLSFDVLSSPICSSVSELNDNEISHTASYSGRYLKAMKDVDENSYNVVQIGSQCWITENLHATHFADGTEIPLGSGTVSYDVPVRYKSGRFDTDNACGYLYNWSAAMHGASSSSANPSNIQGICPVGWHMPSSAEWTQLTDYVSSKSAYWCDASDNTKIGKALASTLYWPAVSTECVPANTLSTNNTTGFNAIPAGVFDDNNNKAAGVDSLVYYWSATEVDAHHANVVGVVYLLPNVYVPTTGNAKNSVVSVRCLRGEGATPCETSMDYTINMGNSADFGRVTINNTNATSASWKDSNDVEIGTWVSGKTDILPVGKYTVELTGISCNKTLSFEILSSPICTVDAVNSNETGSNGQISQLKDVENHTYNVVQIGSQCWTKENMKSKTYAGGDTLGYMHEVSDYPHYDYPNGIAANSDTYGLLYNWYAAVHNANVSNANPIGVQGICPEGWHVPSAAEFTTLTNYVSSKESFLCGDDATKIAKALSGNTGWLDKSTLEAIAAQAGVEGELSECMVSYDLTTNNTTGFSMTAAGICRGTTYNYDLQPGLPSFGLAAVLWTTSSSDEITAAALNWYGFSETISSAESGSYKEGYWSVRCVRGAGNNTPSVTTAAISDTNCTSIICGGNVISDGGSEVTARGVCWSSNGALNLDVDHNHTTDGVGTGEFTSEITGLEAGNTYYIRAYATNAMGTFYGETIKYKHIVELDYTVNLGNSPDFGRVTINNADVTSATWRNASDEVIGTWTTKTDILPVGTYSVEITTPCISTTISGIEVKSSPICTADAVGTNEGAFTPSYSGTYINKLTDVDGNEYQVVQVGTQCWLKEDMRTKHYADGVAITSAYSDNATSEHVPHYINHYEIESDGENMHVHILDTPDLLYNGFAALKMNIDGSDANPSGGLCPDGWHVPSMTEVTALYTYVGQQEEYACNGDASKLGKALASNTGWTYDESDDDFKDCSIGTDFSTNNATGLSLSAGGILAIMPFPQGLASGYWTTSPNPDKDDNNGGDEGPGIIGKELFIAATFTTGENYSQNTCAKIGFMGVRCVRGAGNNTPSVTTSAVSAVTGTTATCGGNVTADGGSTVTARGVCWKKDNNGRYDKFPTVNDSKTTDGTGLGAFSSTLTGLEAGAKYYVRAYATNALGTFYGDTVSFTASTAEAPTVDLWFAGAIAGNISMFIGNVVDSGDAHVTDCGICWSTEPGVSLSDNKIVAQSVTDTFTGMLSSLDACVNYYLRAYATSSAGTGYSDEVSIRVWPSGNASFNSNFQRSGSDGNFGRLSINGNSSIIAKFNLVNSDNEVVYETTEKTWELILPVGAYETKTYIDCGGSYESYADVQSTVYIKPSQQQFLDSLYFKPLRDLFGTEPKYDKKSFASPICRVSSVNTINETEFESPITGTYINKLTDIDGNEYDVVQIGNQCWMRQNLRVTQFADGTPIAQGTSTSSTTAYRYYPNDDVNKVESYGYLYNWAAAMKGADGSNANPSNLQGVCPEGWHVPSNAEWQQLTDYLSTTIDTCNSGSFDYEEVNYFACSNVSDYIARSMCLTNFWPECSTCNCAPNSPMTTTGDVCHDRAINDLSGFNAVPAGYYQSSGARGFGEDANFWSTTNGYNSFILASESPEVIRDNNDKFFGLSVRCVRGDAASLPTVKILSAASGIALGAIMADGGSTVTEKGVCWSTTPGASLSSTHAVSTLEIDTFNVLGFATPISGLDTCIKYYVRAYATNSVGTAYSDEVTVTQLPSSGIGGGYFGYSSNYGNSPSFASIRIDHVNVDSLAWKTRAGQYMGSWRGPSEVLPVGEYFIHVYTNCNGDWYGDGANQASYTSPELAALLPADPDQGLHVIPASPICTVTSINTANETAYSASYSGKYINKLTDKSGNEYDVVQIGEQCWMRENLRTTKFADGTDIDAANYHATDNVAVQGYVYDKDAVTSAANICPSGWHVPSDDEWTQLTDYLGATQDPRTPTFESNYPYRCDESDENSIAKSLASTATDWPYESADACSIGNTDSYTVWNGPDDPRTLYRYSYNNRTGFNAVPVGYWHNGGMDSVGKQANYWTSTGQKHMNLDYPRSTIEQIDSESGSPACSIRCLRD